MFAFLSVLVKGELLNGSGGEEHLKVTEALRKTRARSHNKSPASLRWRGVKVNEQTEEEEFREKKR